MQKHNKYYEVAYIKQQTESTRQSYIVFSLAEAALEWIELAMKPTSYVSRDCCNRLLARGSIAAGGVQHLLCIT